MKVTDYIVEFCLSKGINQAFGYPGGSVANLIDSFYKYRDQFSSHVTYNEQGAAFAACGYAQTAGNPGVAYSIGGPGATNLITGIAHAWFDSIPIVCLTGNVNTYESSKGLKVRQRAFQECEVIPIVSSITKYCAYVEKPEDIRYHLEKAYYYAMKDRRGPVLLDIPMDVTRADINPEELRKFETEEINKKGDVEYLERILKDCLDHSKRPVLILGNGVKNKNIIELLKNAVENLQMPYVTSMIAFDILPNHPLGFGFLGASGSRSANFIAAKADLIISIGSRLDIRQVGGKRDNFAPNAKIIRIDIDAGELEYKLHDDEISFCMDVCEALEVLNRLDISRNYNPWIQVCETIQAKTKGMDIRLPNRFMQFLSNIIPDDSVITTDVGQNQVWTAQSFDLKKNQKVLFSGGFGSMGHALPSAIGAYYGSGHSVFAIAGDGGLQMNIQELQFIVREQIPVKVIVFNNHALGMIRHFQEVWFDRRFYQTKAEGGFTSPSFNKIADAYGIDSVGIESPNQLGEHVDLFTNNKPALIEIQINEDTYEYPKLKFGSPNQDQEPLMDRKLYEELMNL